ncbi:MAG: diguanylate cyclase domain-containing protein, partial [Notoacmeibacter sp.]
QIPVAGLGLWTRDHIISSEIDDVSDRHLLIAQNMAVTLARYHSDLITAFNLASSVHIGVPLSYQTASLFDKLGMNTLCAFSLTSPAKLLKAEGPEGAKCASFMEPGTFRFLTANALSKNATISSLHKVAAGRAYLFAVSKRNDILRVGAIDPSFFRKLAAQVRFGTLGHAVIVDQAGQVLAHPKKEWETLARPLGDVQIVRAMLRGETGVMRFDSPSMKGEMIAGFSGVQGAGWGVMIPQPFSELNLKAYDAVQPIYLIVAIGLLVAATTAVYLAQIVARPLENITQLARNAKSVAELSELPELKGYLAPAEPREIVTAYNGMVRAIRDSEAKVRAQAYVDSLTGILNRRAFNEATEKLFSALQGKKGSSLLFFFDLDGFKSINDSHGHATGDQVLREASKRTIELCKSYFQIDRVYSPLLDEKATINIQSLPIFARMGGDEFVLVIPQAGSLKNRTQFAHRLTECLLEPYVLETQTLKAGASIGCAVFPEGKDNLEAVLLRADAALYHAKARGKGQHC